MWPLLKPGDEILIKTNGPVKVGDIVVAKHPYRADVIWVKRLAKFDELDQAVLVGLNKAESTDSRTQGNVPRSRILGPVTSRLPRRADEQP